MKIRLRPTRVLTLLLLTALASCGSDDPTGLGDLGLGTLSATIDGVQWTSVSAQAVVSNTIIGVGAADLAGTSLGFAFGSQVGTFSIGPGNAYNASYNETQGTTVLSWLASGLQGGSGTITITTLTSDRVAGTFEFVATPVNQPGAADVVVTNGVFDLSLQ